MARVTPIITALNGGEISPRLFGRPDIAKYASSCRRCSNFLPIVQGGVTRRPGTRYVARTKGDQVVVSIPFVFSTVQAYMLEFGPGYIRFFKDGAPIEISPGVPYEVTTPYAAADLPNLRYVQSADVLFLTVSTHAPRKLSRFSDTSWTIETLPLRDGPYLPKNITDTTVTASGASGAVTVTASAAIFVASDVGRPIRIESGTTRGWGTITAFTSSTVVSVTIVEVVPTAATKEWRLGAFGGPRGWPAHAIFHQDRLFLASTTANPQTLWGSVVGDYERHRPGANADDALVLTLNSNTVNAIRWLDSSSVLLVGTTGGEWPIRGGETGLTATNAKTDQDTTVGSAAVKPIRIDNVALFVQRASRRLREALFSFESETYISPDLTTLAEHMTRAGIRRMAWQQTPWAIVWVVLESGELVALTYRRDEKVAAWHRHPLGGTDTRVLDVATIPGVGEDEVWLVVERTVAGQTRRYIERLSSEFWGDDAAARSSAFFVDCGLSYSGPPATTFSGLDHLEGEEVDVLADGIVQPRARVASGSITIDRPSSIVHVGLPYLSEVETMDIEAGAMDGTAQTRSRMIPRVAVRFFQTLGAAVGWRRASAEAFERFNFRTLADPIDEPPPLLTGDMRAPMPSKADRRASIIIRQDQPLPCTVTAIVPTMHVGD